MTEEQLEEMTEYFWEDWTEDHPGLGKMINKFIEQAKQEEREKTYDEFLSLIMKDKNWGYLTNDTLIKIGSIRELKQ